MTKSDAGLVVLTVAVGLGAGTVAMVAFGPALVAADVDRGVGPGHGGQRVAARVVRPVALHVGASGGCVPSTRGVTEERRVVGAGGDHPEAAAVGGEVDVTHVGLERVRAAVAWGVSAARTTRRSRPGSASG